MSPTVLAVVLAVASLIVLVGGSGAVCNALLGSTKRRATTTWRAMRW